MRITLIIKLDEDQMKFIESILNESLKKMDMKIERIMKLLKERGYIA